MEGGLGPLTSFSTLSRCLAAGIVGGFLAQLAVPALKQSLGLVAARAIPRPWTLLTCAFIHENIVSALAYAVGVLFLARIVEPIYGGRELLKYLAAVIVVTSFLTVGVVTVGYYASLTREAKAEHAGGELFRPMGGFEAGIAALLVAVKQLIPDNEVALFGGALKFRAKHLPALFALALISTSLLLGGVLKVASFTLLGTYASWFYLRFIHTRNGIRGDLSDEFRLATFFPQLLQTPMDQVAGAFTRLTGLGAANGSQQQQEAWNYGMTGSALPGSDAGEAARRRERGAKALEERLGLKKAAAVPAASFLDAIQPAPAAKSDASGAADKDVESATVGPAE